MPHKKQEAFPHPPRELPSIETLLKMLQTTHSDRIAVVQCETESDPPQPAAIGILLTTMHARLVVEPCFFKTIRGLPKVTTTKLQIDRISSIRLAFDWLRQDSGNQWASGSFLTNPGGEPYALLLLTGPRLTPTFCSALTELGCPLDIY